MSDLNSVFRDKPIKQDSKVSGFLGWLIEDLKDALPKKRDTSKPRSVLDEERGPLVWIRRIIGWFYFDGRSVVDTISDGDRFSAKTLKRGGTLHVVTWPCKAVSLFLIGLIVVISFQMHMDALTNGKTPDTMTTLTMVGPILAYIIAYQWMFKVRITDDSVTLMNGYFMTKTYKLSEVVLIAKSNGGGYTMHLASGKTVAIFKYVTGHREMIEKLETAARA